MHSVEKGSSRHSLSVLSRGGYNPAAVRPQNRIHGPCVAVQRAHSSPRVHSIHTHGVVRAGSGYAVLAVEGDGGDVATGLLFDGETGLHTSTIHAWYTICNALIRISLPIGSK